MDMQIVIGIVGAVVTFGLSINAFFLKEIIKGLNDMRIRLAELTIQVKNYDHRLETLEKVVERVDQAQSNCKGRFQE